MLESLISSHDLICRIFWTGSLRDARAVSYIANQTGK